MRYEAPSIATISHRWHSRSISVTRPAALSKVEFHSAKGSLESGSVVVAATDQFKQQVGVSVYEGEVAEFVNDQQFGVDVAFESKPQRGAIELREVVEHVAGAGEADRVAADDRLIGEVLGQHVLPTPLASEEDDVGALGDEVELEELLDERSADLLGVLPVEVGDRLEGADLGVAAVDLDERRVELVGAVLIEQHQQPRGDAAEVEATLGRACHEVTARGRGFDDELRQAALEFGALTKLGQSRATTW